MWDPPLACDWRGVTTSDQWVRGACPGLLGELCLRKTMLLVRRNKENETRTCAHTFFARTPSFLLCTVSPARVPPPRTCPGPAPSHPPRSPSPHHRSSLHVGPEGDFKPRSGPCCAGTSRSHLAGSRSPTPRPGHGAAGADLASPSSPPTWRPPHPPCSSSHSWRCPPGLCPALRSSWSLRPPPYLPGSSHSQVSAHGSPSAESPRPPLLTEHPLLPAPSPDIFFFLRFIPI